MSHALKFSQDYQEIKNGRLSHKEAISRTLNKNLSLIDKPKSIGNIVYFTDDSWVVWTGNGWRVCTSPEKEEEDEKNSIIVKCATIELIKRQSTGRVERTRFAVVTNSDGRSG